MKYDLGLDLLLQLDNEVFPMESGYWTKIEAKTVISNEHIPHGIKYSLTLHNSNNIRVLGSRYKAKEKEVWRQKTGLGS